MFTGPVQKNLKIFDFTNKKVVTSTWTLPTSMKLLQTIHISAPFFLPQILGYNQEACVTVEEFSRPGLLNSGRRMIIRM